MINSSWCVCEMDGLFNGLSIDRPKGVVAAGQSFFINANATGVATFKNSMRVGSMNQENSQFYRTSGPVATAFVSCDPTPPSRLWLNLRNLSSAPQGFKQTMVAYHPDATTSTFIDRGYDSVINNTALDIDHNFYSLSPGNDKLTIQTYNTTGIIPIADVFPLGISCTMNTLLATNQIEISACDFDGLFIGIPFYLRERLATGLHAYYDIRTTPYVFDIVADIVNNTTRFAIVFDNTPPRLATPTTAFSVVASPNPYVSGFQLELKSSSQELVEVRVYDVLGKLVETQTLSADALENHVFGSTVATGFYTAVITQGSYKEVIKVIKK